MLYIKVDAAGNATAVSQEGNLDVNAVCLKGAWARKADGSYGEGWLNRNDIRDFVHATQLASSANLIGDGNTYTATDAGEGCYPRFDVILAPAVGSEVSKGFNGDYYHVGKIVKVSPDLRIVTVQRPNNSGIVRFYRRRLTATWVIQGGTFCMVHGVHNELNPSF